MEYSKDFPLTNAQADILATARADAHVRAEHCKSMIALAKSALVKLPHVNEHGDKVQHRCNLQMHNIIDTCSDELSRISWVWGIK